MMPSPHVFHITGVIILLYLVTHCEACYNILSQTAERFTKYCNILHLWLEHIMILRKRSSIMSARLGGGGGGVLAEMLTLLMLGRRTAGTILDWVMVEKKPVNISRK